MKEKKTCNLNGVLRGFGLFTGLLHHVSGLEIQIPSSVQNNMFMTSSRIPYPCSPLASLHAHLEVFSDCNLATPGTDHVAVSTTTEKNILQPPPTNSKSPAMPMDNEIYNNSTLACLESDQTSSRQDLTTSLQTYNTDTTITEQNSSEEDVTQPNFQRKTSTICYKTRGLFLLYHFRGMCVLYLGMSQQLA